MGILILPAGPGLVLFQIRVRDATLGVVAVVALPLGFQVKLGLVRGKFFLLVFMLLRLLVFPHPLLEPSWRPLLELFGPAMDRRVLIRLSTLSGPGSA